MKASALLGLNSRSVLFTGRYNSRKAKRIADSKLATNRVLRLAKVAKPTVYAKFNNQNRVYEFDWNSLPDKFALKPSRGLGGDGIIVIKRRLKNGNFLTTSREVKTIEDLKLHTLDILEGAYSMGNEPDTAFVQEFVGRHSAFKKIAYRGTPDIRVIVFNMIPVMAMLRLPTKESGGRANLHQGALGVGVDIASGITTKAIVNNREIIYKPNSNKKLRGIKVPYWNKILDTAVRAQVASGLGYAGVDIVLHPEKGPMVIELNAQPGLSIQLANMEGLKKRLDRVDDITVLSAEHGVKIAKALFASKFVKRVKNIDDVDTIKAVEEIKLLDVNGRGIKILAKIDTGAWSSAIDISLARRLGLLKKNRIIATRKKLSALGEDERPVIALTFYLAGRKIATKVTVADRKILRYQVLIGRTDLQGFLVSPDIERDKLVKAKW
ncbi:MAG: sugar-transfer associated ATP-grasp domain-containing protein [bacterium]|nr:MAG: sugar-transfer associated ATP-grasp domain-containing protein [bacterium]